MLAHQLTLIQQGSAASYTYDGEKLKKDGSLIEVHSTYTAFNNSTDIEKSFTVIFNDITFQNKVLEEKKKLEFQLLQTQKMESIGTLAAGVAHEINTPIQFIGDNTLFIKDSLFNIFLLLKEYQNTFNSIEKECSHQMNLDSYKAHLNNVIEYIDLEFLKEEIPTALSQSMEGISRVTSIVKAMKDFSHSGSEEMSLESINQAIESTVTISKNEWKYCAELTTNLSKDIPLVKCFIGEIKQVILNLIVNAAHAIAEKQVLSQSLGQISITSTSTDTHVIFEISDNGAGIPLDIQDKVFDHFFTTKEVGVGTGQGLSLAYQTVVKKHQGSIELHSTPGEGTTFTITLPIEH